MLTFDYHLGLFSAVMFLLISYFVNHWSVKEEDHLDRIYRVVAWGISIIGSFIAGSFMGTWVTILVVFVSYILVIWFAIYINSIKKEDR